MTRNMLIDAAHPEEVRVCVLDNGRVEDFDFEFSSRKPLRGNIYLARVTRVEPSLQAAFIEYGGNRHGFLAFNEIHPDYYQIPVSDRRLLQEAEAEEAALAAELGLDSREDDSDLDADDHAGGDEDEGADFRDAERAAAVREEAVQDDGAHEDDSEQSGGSIDVAAARHEVDDAPDGEGDAASSDEGGDDHDADNDEDADASDVDNGVVQRTLPYATEPAETLSADAAANDSAQGDHTADPSEHARPAPQKDKPANARRGALLERYREARRKRQRLLRNYKIQEVVKRRQIMLVQVVKEERGTKGAALTTYMSLAGRYCVLMPNTARGGGISRKIGVAADRKRLRRVVDSLEVPQGMGLIIRTAGAKRTKVEIKRDYDYLTRLWENIRALTLQSIAPCLIYEEASLIKRAIRDLYDKDIDHITVEGDDGYREAKDFMKMLMPSHAKNVRQHKDGPPLFLAHDVESQLDAMYQPTVRLKSGGYLVIHQTEALVAIDVNSGKATRERNIEQTALKTNLEAAKEAARQCRLRDLAGLIVIDFIDMEEQRNNRAVEKRFKDALKDDRARIQVGRISNFGLMEMSRQRRRSGIVDGTTHVCPTCSGAGNVRSDEMAALRIMRAIETSALKERSATVAVRAALDVTLYILNHKRAWLKRIEDAYAVSVEIVADSTKAGDNFELERRGAARELPPTTQVVRADQTEAIEIEAPAVDEPEEADEAYTPLEPDGEDRGAPGDEARTESDGGRRRRRRRRRGRREDGHGQRDEADQLRQPRMGASSEFALDQDENADDAEGGEEPRGDRQRSEDHGDASHGDGSNGDGANGEGRRRRRRGRRGGRRNRHRDGENDHRPGEPRADTPGEPYAATGVEEETSSAHTTEDAPSASRWPDEPTQELSASWDRPAVADTPDVDPAPAPRPAEQAAIEEKREDLLAEPEAPREPRPQRKGWWQKAIGG